MVSRLWIECLFWARTLFQSTFSAVIIAGLSRFLGFTGADFQPIADPPYPRHAIGFFCLIVGVLYLLKKTEPICYGLIEVELSILGFFFAVQQGVAKFDPSTFTMSSAGSIYIAIRGLDNIVSGLKIRYAKSKDFCNRAETFLRGGVK